MKDPTKRSFRYFLVSVIFLSAYVLILSSIYRYEVVLGVTAPTLTGLTAQVESDGSITIVSEVDDVDLDDLTIYYDYWQGSCEYFASYSNSYYYYTYGYHTPITYFNSITASIGGSLTPTSNYATGISTASGANTVTASWDAVTQLGPIEGMYCVYAYVYDGAENSTIIGSADFSYDTFAPTAPSVTNLYQSAPGEAYFDWTDSAVAAGDYYTVSTTAPIGSVTTTGSDYISYYTFTGLLGNTTYYFQVRSSDAAGNNSDWSAVSQIAMPNTAPTITSLTAQVESDNSITIVSEVDDGDDDALQIEYDYWPAGCENDVLYGGGNNYNNYGYHTPITYFNSITASVGGSLTPTTNYVTGVSTASGANTVTTSWDAVTQLGPIEGSYCVYARIFDGFQYTLAGSADFSYDTFAPTAPTFSSVSATGVDTIYADWTDSAVAAGDYYTVSTTAPIGSVTTTGSDYISYYTFTGLSTGTTYDFQVRATDAAGNNSDWSTVQSVSTLNNTAPTDIALSASSVDENSSVGTTIGALSTTDTEGGSMTYTLVSGTGSTDNASFLISGSNLQTNTSLDYETKTSYSVRIQVQDNGGLTYAKAFTITVNDLNDNTPSITGSQTFSIAENASNSASVGTVDATDGDAGTTFSSWTIVSGNGDGVFAINSTSGAITVTNNTNLDYETTTSYTLTVTVGDGTNTSASVSVLVSVTDVNDNSPVITSNSGGLTVAVDVAENTTSVTTVTATDADAGSTITFTVTGGADSSLFSLNTNSGVLTFASAPDYENPSDANGDNDYVVEVTATDGTNTDIQTITVSVTDVNDNTPVITSNSGGLTAAADVAENTTSVTIITATDVDAGSTITFNITGGVDSSFFSLNTTSGVLTFASAPDYENPADANTDNDYVVEVTATDGTNIDMQTITVSVTDVVENISPTLSINSATVATDGTGEVSVSVDVDDVDLDSLSIAYHYEVGACGVYDAQSSITLSSIDSADFGYGSIVLSSNQATVVTTASGANTVVSTWASATDASGANGSTYCIYAFSYDGTVSSTIATTTVTLDNTAPSSTDFTGFTAASTTLTPAWSTATGASTYTVSSTADSDVTTSSLSYPFTSLTPNTEYTFQILATDSYGNATSYSTATGTYTIPAKPLSVTAAASGPSAIKVSWTANNNPAGTSYVVYNASKGVAYTATTSTSKIITGVSSASSYYFTVRAIYNSDNVSYVSSDASNTVTPPAQSNNVVMTITSSTAQVAIPFSFSTDPTETHHVTLDSLTDTHATLTIQSVPVTVSLAAGESQNIDTSGNGRNDTTVTMNSVSSGSASFSLIAIPQNAGTVFGNAPTVDTKYAKAVSINTEAENTSLRDVTLTLSINGSTLMAVSNDPSFIDVSYEDYSPTKQWTLTEGNGTKVVYVKFRAANGSTIIYTDTITLTGQSFDDPDALPADTTTDSPEYTEQTCPLNTEHAYKAPGSAGVYYITQSCTKRPFKSSRTYFTYFPTWNSVTVTTQEKLTNIPNDTLNFMPAGPLYDPQYGALVKTTSDPKVYLLLNDKKYWITDEDVFTTLNYDWTWIEDIDQRLLDKYTTAEEIQDKTTHPQYTLIKYTNNAKVYRLEPNPTDNALTLKRHILNEAIFKSLGFRMDRIVTVPDTEVYADGEVLDAVE